MRYVAYVFWILVLLIAVSFVTLNWQTVAFDYYFNKIDIPLPILLLMVMVIGALLGAFALIPNLIKGKAKRRKLSQKITELEQEIKNLRTIPIKDSH